MDYIQWQYIFYNGRYYGFNPHFSIEKGLKDAVFRYFDNLISALEPLGDEI